MIMRRMFGWRGAATLAELAPELEGLADLYSSGTDWILNEAPVLLFFCADSAGEYGSENANLAVQNANLAAETLGLAAFIRVSSGWPVIVVTKLRNSSLCQRRTRSMGRLQWDILG